MKKIKMIVEKTSTGYSAYADKYHVYTTGSDMNDLYRNMVEALNLYFEEKKEMQPINRKNIQIEFSIQSLFELYPINVKHFANRIGMNYTLLSHYVQGRKNPSDKQTEKIVEGLNEIGRELSEVRLA